MKLIVLLVTALAGVVSSRKLPDFVHKCKISDPEIGNCIAENINNLRSRFAKGIPELGVPPAEPLLIPKAELKSSNPDGLRANFYDIHVYNPSSFEIKKLNVDPKGNTIDVHVYIPYLHITAKYEMNGKILILQLKGSGPGEVNITNIDSKVGYKLSQHEKNGKQYYQLERVSQELNYKVTKLGFKNLFEGRDDLTESTNQVLNENIDEVMKEFKPVVDDTVKAVVDGIVFRVFDRFSINELFDN